MLQWPQHSSKEAADPKQHNATDRFSPVKTAVAQSGPMQVCLQHRSTARSLVEHPCMTVALQTCLLTCLNFKPSHLTDILGTFLSTFILTRRKFFVPVPAKIHFRLL